MEYKKIITHPPRHHCDEILAIAVIHYFLEELPIERTFTPTEHDFEDPSILVLDIGRRFDPKKGNFDHHQDKNIPATNMLVLDHFCKDEKMRVLLKKYLFSYVDAVDRGHIVEGREENHFTPSLSAIVASLNNVEDGFEIALNMAKVALQGFVAMAKRAIEAEQVWEGLEKEDGVAIYHNSDYIVGWNKMAEKENIFALVSQNHRKKGSYKITSRDTGILTIPKHENQNFLHANGFTASYDGYESAFSHAKEIVRPCLA